MRRLVISLALFAIGAPTIPANAQSAQTPAPEIVVQGKRADENKRVCRSAISTGSIMPTKTCKTRGEWEEIRQRSIIAMEQIQQAQEDQRLTQELRRKD